MKLSRKKVMITILILVLFVGICIAGFFIFARKSEPNEDKIHLTALATEQYDSIYVSMYPISNFDSEDFIKYFGLNTKVIYYPVTDTLRISKYLEAAFSSSNEISNVFLGIDPACFKDSASETDALISGYIDRFPDTVFWIIPSTPGIGYWVSLSEKETSEVIDKFTDICCRLVLKSNVKLIYTGSEEWMIANSNNYESDNVTLCDGFASKAFLYSLSKQLNQDTVFEKAEELTSLIKKYRNVSATNADFSDSYIVYIGDSILANDTTSSSIAGVISSANNSGYALLSHGGTSAFETGSAGFTLSSLVDNLILEKPFSEDYMYDFNEGLEKYINDKESISSKQLYFVIIVCLNDYFQGAPIGDTTSGIETYKGSLATNINRLKEAFPDSRIVLVSPSKISYFDYGTHPTSENGDSLKDYIQAMAEVAASESVSYIDAYNGLGIDNSLISEYLLPDLVHPNEKGRFLMGHYIADCLDDLFKK